jgi:hypothetical protein
MTTSRWNFTIGCRVLFLLGVTFARFEARPTAAGESPSAYGAMAADPAVTFTIPLASLDDVRRFDQRPEIAEVIHTARDHSDSPIFVAAYVTADDAESNHADAQAVADELVIEVGGYLANRGIEAERISGKSMGIDPAIGRAVVVSFGIPTPANAGWRARQIANKVREPPVAIIQSRRSPRTGARGRRGREALRTRSFSRTGPSVLHDFFLRRSSS